MFLFCDISCFVISSFCFMQVIKTFGISNLFHHAINELTNITPYSFPLLLKNKSPGSGNVSKITTTAHHCFMIYITCLYQARGVLVQKLEPLYWPCPFNFESYPLLEDMFSNNEIHLKMLSLGGNTEWDSFRNILSLVEDLQKTITVCKKLLHRIMEWFVGMQEKLRLVERKLKVLEKRRAGNDPVLKHYLLMSKKKLQKW